MPARRTGVILAAGFGSRLAGIDEGTRLKPLTPVAGVPLLVRTLRSLETAGCRRIAIVLGHGGHDVESAILDLHDGPAELRFSFNERYDLSNGISLLCAREHVEADFVLTMADHVLSEEVMHLARDHTPPPGGATLLVDYKLDTIFDMDDATKVLEHDGRIVSIGKAISGYNCIDTGVFVCTQGLMEAVSDIYARSGDASISDGVQVLSRRDLMHTLDIGDGFWQDVDTPEMLAHAEAILARRGR